MHRRRARVCESAGNPHPDANIFWVVVTLPPDLKARCACNAHHVPPAPTKCFNEGGVDIVKLQIISYDCVALLTTLWDTR